MSRGFVRVEALILIFILLLAVLDVGLSFLSARTAARDRIRLADVSQIQKALNVYFQENGVYPAAAQNQPAGFDAYLESWPVAPAADGRCSQVQNTYAYAQKSQGSDYSLTFCLGQGSGSIAAGAYTLTNQGIK